MALPHFLAMAIFSALTAVVFAVISKPTPREQVIYGAKVFGAFIVVAVVIGWIMYLIP